MILEVFLAAAAPISEVEGQPEEAREQILLAEPGTETEDDLYPSNTRRVEHAGRRLPRELQQVVVRARLVAAVVREAGHLVGRAVSGGHLLCAAVGQAVEPPHEVVAVRVRGSGTTRSARMRPRNSADQ